MVATMAVAETKTYTEARKTSRIDINAIGWVVHVVKNWNDPSIIGRVVRVVKNIENPARLKTSLLMEAPNAFVFLCYWNFFITVKPVNLTGTILNRLRGVGLLRYTIILTNNCHWQLKTSGRCASLLDGRLNEWRFSNIWTFPQIWHINRQIKQRAFIILT